jgi:hypothetical protein
MTELLEGYIESVDRHPRTITDFLGPRVVVSICMALSVHDCFGTHLPDPRQLLGKRVRLVVEDEPAAVTVPSGPTLDQQTITDLYNQVTKELRDIAEPEPVQEGSGYMSRPKLF